MTDGLVGNDFEVISMIKKLREKSRWFSFGTGNSVNRFLLDNMARAVARSGLYTA
jgi:Ca-activated chloride channel family protein